jgi:hypothetical protein
VKYRTMSWEPPDVIIVPLFALYIFTWLPYPTQNSLPLFEKSCPIAALANRNPKMNINDFIYEYSARITIY